MTKTTKKELVKLAIRWMEEGWQKGNFQIVDELHSINFFDHDPSTRTPDRRGFKEGIKQLYAAFPDLYAKVDDLVVDTESSEVAIRWTATGTHTDVFMNRPPSGKHIRFKGIEIIRIETGKIVERWGEWDGIDLLQQLQGL